MPEFTPQGTPITEIEAPKSNITYTKTSTPTPGELTPYNPTPEEKAAYEAQFGPPPLNPIKDLTAQELADLQVQDKENFDIVGAFRSQPDLHTDPTIVEKVEDAFNLIKQRGFKFKDLPSVGKAAGGVFQTAKGFGKQIWNYANIAGDIVTGAFAPTDTQIELGKDITERFRKNIAGTEEAMTGLAQLGEKAVGKAGRTVGLAKDFAQYTPEEKAADLWSAVGRSEVQEQRLKGQGPFSAAVTANLPEAEKKPLDTHEVETLAAGDPFSFYLFGKGAQAIAAPVKAALPAARAARAAERLATLEKEFAKSTAAGAERAAEVEMLTAAREAAKTTAEQAGAVSKVTSKISKGVENLSTKAGGKLIESAGGALESGGKVAIPIGKVASVAGPVVGAAGAALGGDLTHIVGGGLLTGTGGAALKRAGEVAIDWGKGLSDLGRQIGGSAPVRNAYAQVGRDFLQALPGAAGDVAHGAAIDLGLAALTSETPQETQGAASFGTALGALKGGTRLGGRVVSGQLIAPREYGSNSATPSSGQFGALDALHNTQIKQAPEGVRVHVNAMRKFVEGAAPDTDVFMGGDPAATAKALEGSGVSPETARLWANQNGFFTTSLRGKDGQPRRVIVLNSVDSAPHESFHAIQDVLGEEANRQIDRLVQDTYADRWQQEGENYARKLTGGDLGGQPWQEAVLDSSGWGLLEAKEKLYSEFVKGIRNETGSEPDPAYVRQRVEQVLGQIMDASVEQNQHVDPNTISQMVWREVLSPEEATQVADRYIAREIAAENFDAVFKHAGPRLTEGTSLPEKLSRVAARVITSLGGEPLGDRTSQVLNVPLRTPIVEAVRALGQEKRGNVKPTVEPVAPKRAKVSAPPIFGAEEKTETQVAADEARTLAEAAPELPTEKGTESPRMMLGKIAEAIASQTGVRINYLSAPGEPAAATTSNRPQRRAIIEAFRTMPPEARVLWEKTFFPDRVIQTKSGYQVLGWAPEVFASNAHKMAEFLSKHPELSPYEIDAATKTFTPEAWQELYTDVSKFVQNQKAGQTGAGEPLVVPKNVTERGFTAPAVREGAVALDQTKADFINMLFNFKLPETPRMTKGKLPLNIAGQEVSAATKPGRVEIPVRPRGEFTGEEAVNQGIEGRSIQEVNPFRNEIERVAAQTGEKLPSLIEAVQRLNLENIKEVEGAPEVPEFRGNTLTLTAGFQPREWKVSGTRNGAREEIRVTAEDIASARKQAETQGIRVSNVAREGSVEMETGMFQPNPVEGIKGMLEEKNVENQTRRSWEFGRQVKSVAEVRELLQLRQKAKNDFSAVMNRLRSLPIPEKMAMLDDPAFTAEMRDRTMGTQIVNEALEKATGYEPTKMEPGEKVPVPMTKAELEKLDAEVNAPTAQFVPQTKAGKTLEDRGFTFNHQKADSGVQGVISFLKEGNRVGILNYSTEGKTAHIDGVEVDKNFRRQGVAEAMYRELGSELQSKGIKKLTGDVVAEGPIEIRDRVFGKTRVKGIPTFEDVNDTSYWVTDNGERGFEVFGKPFESLAEAQAASNEYNKTNPNTKLQIVKISEDTPNDSIEVSNKIDPNAQFSPNDEPGAVKSPAYRSKETGKVYTARNHWEAFQKAEEAEGRGKISFSGNNTGFVTNDGEFLNRKAAGRRAVEMGQVEHSSEEYGLNTLAFNRDAQFSPNDEPGAVKGPALKDSDGKIYSGEQSHAALLGKYPNLNLGSTTPVIYGFITNDGDFLNRRQAYRRAEQMGQEPASEGGILHTGDIQAQPNREPGTGLGFKKFFSDVTKEAKAEKESSGENGVYGAMNARGFNRVVVSDESGIEIDPSPKYPTWESIPPANKAAIEDVSFNRNLPVKFKGTVVAEKPRPEDAQFSPRKKKPESEQEAQAQFAPNTENFKRWFGGSKAVDEAGEPLRLFHGTTKDISEFEAKRVGNASTTFSNYTVPRYGIFLTDDPKLASSFPGEKEPGSRLVPLYLRAEEPLDLRKPLSEGFFNSFAEAAEKDGGKGEQFARFVDRFANREVAWELFDEDVSDPERLIRVLKSMGYDSARIFEPVRDGVAGEAWVAFDPEQVKSATGNQGTFDETGRISFSPRRKKNEPEPYSAEWYAALSAPTGKRDPELSFIRNPSGFSKAWVLPDGKAVQIGGMWHHQWLDENPEVAKKYKLDVPAFEGVDDDATREAALKKGFVRINYNNNTGEMTVEAIASKWPKLRTTVARMVEQNADDVAKGTVYLLNDTAKAIVDSSSKPLFDYDTNKEKVENFPFLSDDVRRSAQGTEGPQFFEPPTSQSQPRNIDYDAAEDFLTRRDAQGDLLIRQLKSAKPGQIVSWNKVPAARLKKIWLDFGKTGVLRDEKGMQNVADSLLDGIARLKAANELMGHDSISPAEAYERFGHEWTPKLDEKATEFFTDERGAWTISDYGIDPLMRGYDALFRASTPEEQLFAADKILNVIHQRSDLPALFVEGGTKTLNEIATQGGYVSSDSQLQPRPKDENLPGFDVGREFVGNKAISNMTRAELEDHFPEAYIPRNRADEVPSEIVKSPLYKQSGSEEKAVKAFADKVVAFADEYKDSPEFKAGARWYSDFAPALKKTFGKNAQLMAELLAATSPQTSVETNFKYAFDALRSFESGRFDKIIPKFEQGLGMIADDSWIPWYNRENKAGRIPEPPRNPTPAAFMEAWINKNNLIPLQSNGKRYGTHSIPVLQVFARQWLTKSRGLKTLNFVKNLVGSEHEATIDLWADRTMRRAGYEGFKPRWRILPENVRGVADEDFRFGQKVFRAAAEKLGMNPDDLQGALWFAEKKLWADRGWGRLDLGDFGRELEKIPMLESAFQQNKAQETSKKADTVDMFIEPRKLKK